MPCDSPSFPVTCYWNKSLPAFCAHRNPLPTLPEEGPCSHPPSSSSRRKMPWGETEVPPAGDNFHGATPLPRNHFPSELTAPDRFGWCRPAHSSAFRSRKKGQRWWGDCLKQANNRKNHKQFTINVFLSQLSDTCHVQQASAFQWLCFMMEWDFPRGEEKEKKNKKNLLKQAWFLHWILSCTADK